MGMTDATVTQITLVYRGETQRSSTVSPAAHFLRQVRIKVGWFHMVKATVDLMANGKVNQTRYLKGDKYFIMKELARLEGSLKPSSA
jgi:hypothetical protein